MIRLLILFALLALPGLSYSDTTSPDLSNVAVSAITSTGATVSWTTNEPSTTVLSGGVTYSNLALVINHVAVLTGLTPATAYSVAPGSADAAGNLCTEIAVNFTTLTPSDTTPPMLTFFGASNVTHNSVTISWTTDEPATTVVNGDLTHSSTALVTTHSVDFTGLTPTTTYSFGAASTDAAGNTGTRTPKTFTTLVAPDSTPPVISGLSVTTTTTTATITWQTNEPATTELTGGVTFSDPALTTQHSVILTGLIPGGNYAYSARSVDAASNAAVLDSQFVTTPIYFPANLTQ